ncbi:hypothetical protein PL71_14475 [Pseudoalteromonas distincta]|uniref:Uncharacterized protein n=1 Tax=Pseudoalteromonas distincta TaxID=77608 RepID=A0ABT9GGT4_9GAMM|nr:MULTISPECIES: hypothetical protein [Pseudoalteromonas distincta group]KHM46727.1 hypothetical protein PL71_14475 [Pseudoalteromonas elyakovii]KID39388.1 hypothetical protein QT16_07580 [Pseudoalteromonas distincta]MDP4485107.1 hypothetical protein [Pseudoalteromonas elyakovii]
MKKSKGLTEKIWSSIDEDKKIKWRFFSVVTAVIGVLLIEKSGNEYFDWFLKLLTTIFLFAVIHTQRSYSKITPKLRKFNTKVAIILGTWAIVVFGLAIYLQVIIVVSAQVFLHETENMMNQGLSQYYQITLLIVFLVVIPIATINTYKSLKINDLIFHLPKAGLFKLLARREPKASTFIEFAYLELAAIILCLIYFSSIAVVARSFIDLIILLMSLF